ncbi:MAG: DUF3122 domain-containing protein [Microcystaceae cyanobacterium]
MEKIWRIGIGVLLMAIAVCGCFVEPAQANLRTITESPGQVLYQSRETLQDQAGNTWQVVFFKRVETKKAPVLNLRLVGFPETVVFNHPAPLSIANNQQTLLAEDIFATKNPAPNVGQYDLQKVLEQLSDDSFWELTLPLVRPQNVTIKIPYFLIKEWQAILNS